MVAFSGRAKGFLAAVVFAMAFCLPQFVHADDEPCQCRCECTWERLGVFGMDE